MEKFIKELAVSGNNFVFLLFTCTLTCCYLIFFYVSIAIPLATISVVSLSYFRVKYIYYGNQSWPSFTRYIRLVDWDRLIFGLLGKLIATLTQL